jgi:hypothetical protein
VREREREEGGNKWGVRGEGGGEEKECVREREREREREIETQGKTNADLALELSALRFTDLRVTSRWSCHSTWLPARSAYSGYSSDVVWNGKSSPSSFGGGVIGATILSFAWISGGCKDVYMSELRLRSRINVSKRTPMSAR